MKQITYYYLCLKVALKAIVGGYLLAAAASELPLVVFGVCFFLVIAGAVIAVRHYKNLSRASEIPLFFFFELIGTIFNLVFVNQMALVETTGFDMIITGTLLDIILAALVVGVAAYRYHMAHLAKQLAPQHSTAGKLH